MCMRVVVRVLACSRVLVYYRLFLFIHNFYFLIHSIDSLSLSFFHHSLNPRLRPLVFSSSYWYRNSLSRYYSFFFFIYLKLVEGGRINVSLAFHWRLGPHSRSGIRFAPFPSACTFIIATLGYFAPRWTRRTSWSALDEFAHLSASEMSQSMDIILRRVNVSFGCKTARRFSSLSLSLFFNLNNNHFLICFH